MAFEMICGQCCGNLLVEQFGVVVACPHCGAHLHVPAPADLAPVAPAPVPTPMQQVTPPVPAPQPPPPVPEPIAKVTPPVTVPVQVEVTPVSEPVPATEEMIAFTGQKSEPPASVEISVDASVSMSDSASAVIEHVTEEAIPTTTDDGRLSLSALMSSSEAAASEAPTTPPATPFEFPQEPVAATSQSTAPPAVTEPALEPTPVAVIETAPSGLSGLFGSSVTSAPQEAAPTVAEPSIAESSHVASAESASQSESSSHDDHSTSLASGSGVLSASTVTKPADKDHVLISKSVILILFSYSSAITLGFLYLLYYGSANSKDYGLESLPDVVPAKKKAAGISVYKESAEMPDGHELKVGDRQRFGNIEVNVLKVTRGSVHFRHFKDASKPRLPSAPVLKLWLRFKNVSSDQEIAPLDDQLLFTRAGKTRFEYRSNQFVCRAEQKENRDALRVIAFDHKIGSGWDLAGLPLDKPLKPGESRDYYIPTCENDLDKLTGDLLWRVHIRKGYSSRGNGVTTLFEVHFNSNVIRDESA